MAAGLNYAKWDTLADSDEEEDEVEESAESLLERGNKIMSLLMERDDADYRQVADIYETAFQRAQKPELKVRAVLNGATARYKQGDFAAARKNAVKAEELQPGHSKAKEIREACEKEMYAAFQSMCQSAEIETNAEKRAKKFELASESALSPDECWTALAKAGEALESIDKWKEAGQVYLRHSQAPIALLSRGLLALDKCKEYKEGIELNFRLVETVLARNGADDDNYCRAVLSLAMRIRKHCPKHKIQLPTEKRERLFELLELGASSKNHDFNGQCGDALAEAYYEVGLFQKGIEASREAILKLSPAEAADCALSAGYAINNKDSLFFFQQAYKNYTKVNQHFKAGQAALKAAVLIEKNHRLKLDSAEDAARSLKAAAADSADSKEKAYIYFLLAQSLLLADRPGDAIQPARKSLLSKTDDKTAFDRLDQLADALALCKRFEETIQVLRQALYLTQHTRLAWSSREKDNARVIFALATAYEEMYDFSSSQPLWSQAANLFSQLDDQKTSQICIQRAAAAATHAKQFNKKEPAHDPLTFSGGIAPLHEQEADDDASLVVSSAFSRRSTTSTSSSP